MEYWIEDNVPEGHQERPERTVGRRQLLKVLIAAGGAVTTSAVLSNRWIRPIVEAGVLHAHAQVTYTPTPTPTFRNICYTPTPTILSPTIPPPATTPPSPITQESRRSLLERLLAEERFPPRHRPRVGIRGIGRDQLRTVWGYLFCQTKRGPFVDRKGGYFERPVHLKLHIGATQMRDDRPD